MGLNTTITGATNAVLQESIGAYSYEAYTNAKRLINTAIVGTNPEIDRNTETYIGQLRWHKPLNPTVNVASISVDTPGAKTGTSSDYLAYIKTVRTHGASKVNMAQVITQEDGLAQIGMDFAETQAQDEHSALLALIKGVAIAEALNGAATGSGLTGLGGQTFDNDPADKRYGFYVDLASNKLVIPATTAIQGAARAEGFLQAMGMAWKDYEPPYAYLVASPETIASLRSANLVDNTTLVENGVEFNTIFGGKLRLIQTRANQSMSTAQLAKVNSGAGVDITGTKTSFIVLPGSVSFTPLEVPLPVEIERDAAAYMGGGTTDIWYRWGYILHPAGYNWAGSQDKFPSDAEYGYSVTGGVPEVLTSATVGATTTGTWIRKVQSALSLGILPVFHS